MQNDLGMFRPPQKTHNLSQYNFNGSKEGRFVVLLQEKKIDEPGCKRCIFSSKIT